MAIITKELFLTTIACPTLGWLTQRGKPKEACSISDRLRIEEGLEIQQRARSLFTEGYLVQGNNETAASKTQELLQDKNVSIIFEATFLVDGYVTKADILIREGVSWRVIEVKSGVNLKSELVDDLAYTVMVATKAGLKVANCSLMLISKDYRLGLDNDKLFVTTDQTAEIFDKIKEFDDYWLDVIRHVSQESKPNPELLWYCRNCDIFEECVGKGIDNHIFSLPRISQAKFNQLKGLEVIDIGDIPNDFKLTDNQIKVKEAVQAKGPVINQQRLQEDLDLIKYPAFYLDFETVQTAIPLYENTAPYTQIPTQYSLHICNENRDVVQHMEYLADPSKDCRKELAKKLIHDCGSEGKIIVYTSFEKTIINELAESFPDLAKELKGLINRLVDLCKIISKNYYHPGFKGSYSIKNVLPVMVGGLNYNNMDVSNGMDASATFAYLAKGEYSKEEAEKVKKDLLEYCELDTLAMLKVACRLKDLIKGNDDG